MMAALELMEQHLVRHIRQSTIPVASIISEGAWRYELGQQHCAAELGTRLQRHVAPGTLDFRRTPVKVQGKTEE